MLHLFHGEHVVASRKELSLLKEKFASSEIIVLDGNKVSFTDLIQATESTSLFGGSRLVVIENLLGKRAKAKKEELLRLTEWIANIPKASEVVYWEDKELGKTLLGLFPKTADIALFRPEQYIFKLVENVRPGNISE